MKHFLAKGLPKLTDEQQRTVARLSTMDLSTYNETDVREEFIAPLISLLGYARDKDYAVLREESFRGHEWVLSLGHERYKLDYRFVVWKQGFWLLEAKSARRDARGNPPDISERDVQQAFGYAIHPKVDASMFAVSNGWQTKLFDRDVDSLDPIYSFTQADLPQKLEGFRRYVDASQVTFHIKRKLLVRIKQALSSDVSFDRVDEFVDAVQRVGSDVKPVVRENMRRAIDLSEGTRKVGWVAQLEASGPQQLVETLLSVVHFPSEVANIAASVVKKVHFEPQGYGDASFVLERSILSPARAVLSNYYINVLIFLDELARHQPTARKFDLSGVPTEKTLRELACWWCDVLLDHLRPRPELRMLWLLEGILYRTTKRFLACCRHGREEVLRQVDIARFYRTEESMALFGPSPARSVLETVEAITMMALGRELRGFYDYGRREYIPAKAHTAYRTWSTLEDAVAKVTPDYSELLDALGEEWHEIQSLDETHRYLDNLGPAVCNVLAERSELLTGLSPESHRKLAIFAALGNQAAEKCCAALDVKVPQLTREQRIATIQSFYAL